MDNASRYESEDSRFESWREGKFVFSHYFEFGRLFESHRPLYIYFILPSSVDVRRSRGAMDNASDYGSEDTRLESWRDRKFVFSHYFEFGRLFESHRLLYRYFYNLCLAITSNSGDYLNHTILCIFISCSRPQ